MFSLLARDMLINEIAWREQRDSKVAPDNIVYLILTSYNNWNAVCAFARRTLT